MSVALFVKTKEQNKAQTNGKTRDVVELAQNIEEKKIVDFVTKKTKVKKFLEGKTIIKHIYIKNKLINLYQNFQNLFHPLKIPQNFLQL